MIDISAAQFIISYVFGILTGLGLAIASNSRIRKDLKELEERRNNA